MHRPVHQLREDVWIVTCNKTGHGTVDRIFCWEGGNQIEEYAFIAWCLHIYIDMTLELLYSELRIWVWAGHSSDTSPSLPFMLCCLSVQPKMWLLGGEVLDGNQTVILISLSLNTSLKRKELLQWETAQT